MADISTKINSNIHANTPKYFGKRVGLAGLACGAAIAAGVLLSCADKANGGMIKLISNFGSVITPDVSLHHEAGATDEFDEGLDGIYTTKNPPVVDFYSVTSYGNLSRDRRGLSSTSTFTNLLQGNGLDYSTNGNGTLDFLIVNEDEFNGLLFADIYKNGNLEIGNINIRDYCANPIKVPLALTLTSNSDYYNINVRVPEPATATILALGAASLGMPWLNPKKNKTIRNFRPKN